MRHLIPALALLCAACAPPSSDERIRTSMDLFIGTPLTHYIEATGATPTSFYDKAGGARVFVFERTYPYACTRSLTTRRVSNATSPDSFVISGYSAVGACAGF